MTPMQRFWWPAPGRLGPGFYDPWLNKLRDAPPLSTDRWTLPAADLDVVIGRDADIVNLDPVVVLQWTRKALGDLRLIGKGVIVEALSVRTGNSPGERELQITLRGESP